MISSNTQPPSSPWVHPPSPLIAQLFNEPDLYPSKVPEVYPASYLDNGMFDADWVKYAAAVQPLLAAKGLSKAIAGPALAVLGAWNDTEVAGFVGRHATSESAVSVGDCQCVVLRACRHVHHYN